MIWPFGGPAPLPVNPLPWWKVAAIVAAIFLVSWAADLQFGRAATAGAIGGMMVGLMGTMFGDLGRAALAVLLALAGLVLAVHAPFWVGIAVVIPTMAALVAIDAARTGARGLVLALFGWIICLGPAGTAEERGVLAAFLLAATAALALAWGLGIARHLPGRPGGRRYGIALFVFLWAGLAGTVTLARHLGDPHSNWAALMFALRGLTPPRAHAIATLRFGIGTVVGALGAATIELLAIPDPVLFALAPLILMGGVRYLGAPSALAPGLLTLGVLFAVAPTVHSAEFRTEAAVLVAILAEIFAWLVDRAPSAETPS